MKEMKEESKSREEAMINEIETKSKNREEASIAREEAMMKEMKNMSNLYREMKENKEKSQSEIKILHFELAVVTLACLGISLVAFQALRRGGM